MSKALLPSLASPSATSTATSTALLHGIHIMEIPGTKGFPKVGAPCTVAAWALNSNLNPATQQGRMGCIQVWTDPIPRLKRDFTQHGKGAT